MNKLVFWLFAGILGFSSLYAQVQFPFRVELKPLEIADLPGLHSYAFASHRGKLLVVGGRLDGLHARQPFRSFPQNQNNSSFFVIDHREGKFIAANHDKLPATIHEQLQSTNMNFYQNGDTLVIAGGYAFSPTVNDHITFPYLVVIDVPSVIEAIENDKDLTPFIHQIRDERMAVTGGNLGKLKDTYLLVGGHRFDGRYNPMGHNTYVQTYTEAIRSFRIVNDQGKVGLRDFNEHTDSIHLHRRDYNLLPVIADREMDCYVLSAGVFQHWEDLPMMYPVEVAQNRIKPMVSFNQLLSNYHGAKATFYNSQTGDHHYLFFGGMSQFVMRDGQLYRDTLVPFVSTISVLQRNALGDWAEAALQDTLPGLRGTSAEFIPALELATYSDGVIDFALLKENRTLIGYIYGGIESKMINAFSTNRTDSTRADSRFYEVYLVRDTAHSLIQVNGRHEYGMQLKADSRKEKLTIRFKLDKPYRVGYVVRTEEGTILYDNDVKKPKKGTNKIVLNTKEDMKSSKYLVTLLIDRMYYAEKEVVWRLLD